MKGVWITGAGGGLGRHLVKTFIEAGDYFVFATDINDAALKKLNQDFEVFSNRLLTSYLDITCEEQWDTSQKSFQKAFSGPLMVMINNAGYLKPGFIKDVSGDDISRHIDTNLKGVILGSRQALKIMSPHGKGSIINIASLASIAPVGGLGLYSASKFAVRGFSLALAQEAKILGIDVSVVCPDVIATPMRDLQIPFPEAAMTFSGKRPLTTQEVVDAIMKDAIGRKKLVITLPKSRGMLAQIPNVMPNTFVPLLSRVMMKIGERKRLQLARQS